MTQTGTPREESSGTRAFRDGRDFLLAHREDYETTRTAFRWPELDDFNWATDWFDRLGTEQPNATALWVVEEDGSERTLTFAELADRSRQAAGWLAEQGLQRGDRVLLVLGNCVPLWELMLACIRLGVVIIPATTLLSPADVVDRVTRGRAKAVVAHSADVAKFGSVGDDCLRVSVGEPVDGWLDYAGSDGWAGTYAGDARTKADDPLLLYFTSGTTAQPKLVEHTHASYPVGHLSTMYWIGLQPGDVHLNISSPGWAKHAWSCLFAPWNAGATILIFNYARFDAAALLDVMRRCGVTTFCAPPTVWRMLVQQDLGRHQLELRECVGAGEPLNPEVIEQVQRAWGLTIRDGFGQTETTAQVGNSPGQPVKLGSMGRPLPGYVVTLVDPVSGDVVTEPGAEGELCLELARRPLGLMTGYHGDHQRTGDAMRGGFYHTGDVATVDEDGYVTYVGRADDVFKASDYRISPFDLESVLIEHEAVAEAAVVPSPDPVRLAVPKAFVVLVEGQQPSADLAQQILTYAREHLAPYKRIRRLEFVPAEAGLPKTISGKIRRVELRAAEQERAESDGAHALASGEEYAEQS
ncbi:MAG: AMP-binding protein [Propionibacteriales bacterium]|nr:AMP-binding protein [Propionibacteriales bacterium]